MSEFEWNILPGEQKFLGILPEQLEPLATRLQTFIDVSATNYLDRGHRTLGLVSPNKLQNKGVGQIFFAIWFNDGNSTSGDELVPMEIWLARGKSVSGKKVEQLDVDFISLGKLKHGTRNIVPESHGGRKLKSSYIYPTSTVILTL